MDDRLFLYYEIMAFQFSVILSSQLIHLIISSKQLFRVVNWGKQARPDELKT